MNFLKRMFAGGCLHRFSWPRIDENGRHYQVCSLCGISYEYDWKEMKRTGRPLIPHIPGALDDRPGFFAAH
jgi:hypothetical protein